MAIFTYALTRHGVPALRHDWFWPRDGESNYVNVLGLAQGWADVGLGVPNFRPTGYFVAIVLGPTIALLGPVLGFVAWSMFLGALCVLAAMYVCKQFDVGLAGTLAIATFALLNPWVYTEVVAGHHLMLVGFAGFLFLVAVSGAKHDGARGFALFCTLVVHQIQYLMIAMLLAVFVTLRTRSWLPVMSTVVFAAPFFIGLLANFQSVESTPYTVDWIRALALSIQNALTLSGYFTRYDVAFDGLGRVAMWVIVGIAAFGLTLRRGNVSVRSALVLGASTLLLTILISNASNPSLVSFFARFSALQLFRDPYTMVCLIAVMLVVGSAAAAAACRALAIPLLLAAATLSGVWLAAPPSGFWTDLRDVPLAPVRAATHGRFALEPAIQPLRFAHESSSGLDPDSYPRLDGSAPLNGVEFAFPEVVAFSRLLCKGATGDLEALGVTQIVQRPWLSSDALALGDLLTGDLHCLQRRPALPRTLTLHARPLLALTGMPSAGTLANDQRNTNVFFGDVAGLKGRGVPAAWRGYAPIEAVIPPHLRTAAKDDWIDSRLAYFTHPDLGQAFGGAYTEQRAGGFGVAGKRWLLVYVDGELFAQNGPVVAQGTGDFAWRELNSERATLHCIGACAVLGTASRVPRLALNPRERTVRRELPLAATARTSWLYTAHVEAGAEHRLLRFNVRYDRSWTAFVGREVLPHFRVNTTINGWIMPAGMGGDVLLVETTSAMQSFSILIALGWLIFLLFDTFVRQRRPG